MIVPRVINRRHFLTGTMLAGLAAELTRFNPSVAQDTASIPETSPINVALLGQALIAYPLPPQDWPARAEMAEFLKPFDVCFTNFETVVKGPRAGAPTRDLLTLHTVTPEAIDTLKAIHVNLMSTANNHAFDVGTGGILDTIDAMHAAGMSFAGTGQNVTQASTPGVVETRGGSVALIACATGKIREGGMATATRPGVNEVRRGPDGAPLPEDETRILTAISDARHAGHAVIAYHHNHDWEPEQVNVPEWQRVFAKKSINAGAAVFVGHGVPQLQAMDVHNGAPILYGLGSFMFQTAKPVGAYGPESWQSVIADCTLSAGRCTALTLTPLVLNEVGLKGADDMVTRGAPSFADPARGRQILEHIAALSRRFGTRFDIITTGLRPTARLML